MSYRRMCVSRARNDILRNAMRRGWLAAKGETIEKPTNLSHPERRHHRKRDGCCWSASRKPMRASGNQLDSWSGMKSTAMWEITADISKGELERRIAIFDTGHYKHRPTLTLHGHKFRYVAPPAGAPSLTSATAKSDGRDEPGHYKRRRAYSALTTDSVIFFASPSSIIVLSR